VKLWKILIGVLLLAIGFFVFRACRTTTYTNFPPTATGDWIAFGDSLTAGFGASGGNDYPTLLSAKIGRKILNKGVPGETTENALNRVEGIVRMQPRVVLLCLGGNDALQQLPMDKTFANLSTIIDRLQAGGSFVVLIGVRSASIRDRYDKEFKKLAKEKHVLLVPNILSGILGTPNLMSDYVHPNDNGYKAIAERLEKILNPLLPKL
jgi:lysophospholipase L1-like esterase